MSQSTKEQLYTHTVNYMTNILLLVIDSSHNGDLSFADSLGIDTKLLKNIESLTAREMEIVARKYADKTFGQMGDIDSAVLSDALNLKSVKRSDSQRVDQFILRGASNACLMELFGWQTAHLSGRRSVLGYKAKKGRAYQPTEQAKDDIYHYWLGIKIESDLDYADKIYMCSVDTEYPINVVYKLVKDFERQTAYSVKTSHQSQIRYIV